MIPPIPPGYALSTPEQMAALQAALLAVQEHLAGIVQAVAVVVVVDGAVSAGLVGETGDLRALSMLAAEGPEVLRITIERMRAGGGDTRIIRSGASS